MPEPVIPIESVVTPAVEAVTRATGKAVEGAASAIAQALPAAAPAATKKHWAKIGLAIMGVSALVYFLRARNKQRPAPLAAAPEVDGDALMKWNGKPQ